MWYSVFMQKNTWLLLVAAVLVIGFLVVSSILGTGPKKQDSSSTNSTSSETSDKPEMKNTKLTGVGAFVGSGTAIDILDKTTFSHSVVAEVSDPPTGKFYEGWLVSKSSTKKYVSTGKLEKKGRNYTVNFVSQTNYYDYPEVVVTLETESLGLDNQPETHVLEGSF